MEVARPQGVVPVDCEQIPCRPHLDVDCPLTTAIEHIAGRPVYLHIGLCALGCMDLQLDPEVAALAASCRHLVHHRLVRVDVNLLEGLLECQKVVFPVVRSVVYRNMYAPVLVCPDVHIQQDGLERSLDRNVSAGKKMPVECLVVTFGHVNGLDSTHLDSGVHPEILQMVVQKSSGNRSCAVKPVFYCDLVKEQPLVGDGERSAYIVRHVCESDSQKNIIEPCPLAGQGKRIQRAAGLYPSADGASHLAEHGFHDRGDVAGVKSVEINGCVDPMIFQEIVTCDVHGSLAVDVVPRDHMHFPVIQ